MRKWLLRLLYAAIAFAPAAVYADYLATQGSGSTVFAFTCFTTKLCPALVNMNSSGTEIMTTSNPAQTQIGDGTRQVPVIAASTATAAANPSLPSNESPNSQLSVATGTTADSAYAGSGSASIVSILKGLYTGITSSIPAGTNNIGFVTTTPSTTGGWTYWSTPNNNSNTALTTTVVAVKSSAAGNFGGYYISNPNAAVSCVQVFDVATSGGVTLGTTRPNLVFCIPATSAANFEMVNGVKMSNGIQIAATTTASGSSAPSTGLDVTILYK